MYLFSVYVNKHTIQYNAIPYLITRDFQVFLSFNLFYIKPLRIKFFGRNGSRLSISRELESVGVRLV